MPPLEPRSLGPPQGAAQGLHRPPPTASLSATTQALHRQLYSAVLGGRQSWFDANPTGRVLNRFTRDTEKIDENVPNSLASNPQP